MGSGPSSVNMDSPPQDNPSPCRLTLTRREEGWAVKQPINSPPSNLPDNVPPLKLCFRNRRWAIDGRALRLMFLIAGSAVDTCYVAHQNDVYHFAHLSHQITRNVQNANC